MYTLKSIARRASSLGAAVAVLTAAIIPAIPAYADALNPLTDRSLSLSSSSPGWDYKDGSGNATYAPPNSGANGKKTGNTFDFKVSTDSTASGTNAPVKAMTFQYCTTSAGNCLGPGNNGWTGGNAIDNSPATEAAKTANLEIATSSPSQATAGTYANLTTGAVTSIPAANSTGSNFLVYYRTSDNGTPTDPSDDTWANSSGWTMTAHVAQTGTEAASTSTGANNQIELVNTTGQGFTAGQEVKIVFFATDSNYITNPGAGAFFVKINTFSNVDVSTPADPVVNPADVIDGGVTVANVMNQSIQITTKVLETMDFSVGTVDPYTLQAKADLGGGEDLTSQLYAANHNVKHGVCDRILTGSTYNPSAPNVLRMGNADGEFSLETAHTYSTHSYWRLSSNSSAGATVYYSGNTLSNTVNDKIAAIGATAQAPLLGSEQFGLALDNGSSGSYAVDYNLERVSGKVYEDGADNLANGLSSPLAAGIDSSVTDNAISNVDANASWHSPRLAPLAPTTQYGDGS
ncbi:MAG: hypothetical protein WC426_14155, partial [Sulfuriferula sp.]